MNSLEIENLNLRKQIQALLDEARVNEIKWRRIGQFEKLLIATHKLSELIRIILNDYKSATETDAVTLVLCDSSREIRRILEGEKYQWGALPGLVLLDRLYSNEMVPHLGNFDCELERAIFDPWPSGCQSMILLPLMRQNELIGSLNLASRNADRFSVDSSTDFVERLANIFAICLENALNHERLKQVGLTDPLTGLFNRRYFESRCQEEIANVRRNKTPLSCMFLDIDKFKRINDTYGHPAGDQVLRQISQKIKEQLRVNDVLARFGGEEFVVLLPQTKLGHACEIAERIRFEISSEQFSITTTNDLPVTISIGVTQAANEPDKDDKELAQQLLTRADEALYVAKTNGRNRVISKEAESVSGELKILRNLINS